MADQSISQTSVADSINEITEDIDRSIEAELNPDGTQADAMNLDGGNDANPSATNGVPVGAGVLEARISAKKDATLREFLGKMDEYAPIVSRSY
jgi:transcription initiation factor TFIID subunit 10